MKRIAGHAHRISRALGTLLLLGITVVCLACITPAFLGYERYVITGGSMEGTIPRGSVVLEEQVPVEDLAVGDVITYLPPAGSGAHDLVTHRITAVTHDDAGTRVFRTQGDANPDPDPWKFSLISGTQPVVTHSVPYLGNLFIVLADPQIRMAVIGVPAALVALVALQDLIRTLKRPAPVPATPRTASA